MASYTTNLNLKKPALTDGASIADINGNMDAIDAGVALKTQAIKNITRNGTTFTATRCDNTTFTFTQQDNNTTYSAGTDLSLSGTTFNHANSGVTANTYGPSANVTGSDGATILVPQVTVNARGHVTSVTNRTYTSVNTWRGVQNNLTSDSTSDSLTAAQGKALANGSARDSTKAAKTEAIKNITRSGTTFTATRCDGTTFTFTQQDNNTTYSAGTDMSLSSTTFNHANSGVVAGTYGPSTNVTGDNGNTITVPQIAVNARGHVTGVNTRTYTSVNTWRPVENSLTSTSTTASLTAAQGKALNDKMALSAGSGTRNTTYTSSGSCSYSKQRCGGTYVVHVDFSCTPVAGKSSENVAVYFTGLPVPRSMQPVVCFGASQNFGNFCTILVDGSGNLRPWYCGNTMAVAAGGHFCYLSNA